MTQKYGEGSKSNINDEAFGKQKQKLNTQGGRDIQSLNF